MSNRRICVVLFRHDAKKPTFLFEPRDKFTCTRIQALIGCETFEMMAISPELGLYSDGTALLNDNRFRPNACLGAYLPDEYESFYGNVLLAREVDGVAEDVTKKDVDELRQTLLDDLKKRRDFYYKEDTINNNNNEDDAPRGFAGVGNVFVFDLN